MNEAVNTRTPATPDAVHLSLDGFEGPLDLLLDLARRQRVDLARISVVALVEQFIAAVADPRQTDLIRAADWLVMAAWLAWLKSRLLLPTDPEEARQANQAQAVLTQRLIELDRVRAVADWLDGQPQLGWDTFGRGAAPPPAAVVPVASYVMLMEACLDVLRQPREHRTAAYEPPRPVIWTVPQAIARIRAMLGRDSRERDLLEFVPKLPAGLPHRETSLRVAITSTLCAGLEMARIGRVGLRQPEAFGPIAFEAADTALDNQREEERPTENASWDPG